MDFVYSTGGRENYFKKADVRDCVTRAIANATGIDYLEVYNGINAEAKKEHAFEVYVGMPALDNAD